MHDTLFVFDTETIPDTDAVPGLVDNVADDIEARRAALSQYHLDATNGQNDFPRQPFHKVVALSYVTADIEKQSGYELYTISSVRSGGTEESDEAEIVSGFFNYLAKEQPRLVTYNGRNFDLPVLWFRAMKHGISANGLFSGQRRNKWDNYLSRNAVDFHCDLIDALKGNGMMHGGLKLNEICAILNLPGKIGVDGSKVTGMFDAGQIAEIRAYCETDVLNTYLVYLHWQHVNGITTDKGLEDALTATKDYLSMEAAEKAHFKEFLDAWHNAQK